MVETEEFENLPQDWPGNPWIEGRTIVRLPSVQERPTHMPRGPAKRTGPGFLNPAMAPARTRSVLLLADALEHDWIGKSPVIRAIDVMCSTGIRVRRWRNEIPPDLQNRLQITANDMDEFALKWAVNSCKSHPSDLDQYPISATEEGPVIDSKYYDINGIRFQKNDARIALFSGAWQWIDIDPFGSPINFIDSALQNMARIGVLEVTATDTAALTGSSPTAGKRRYGSKGITDEYQHDDAIRVLIGTIARSAAKIDKAVKPILAMFDGHHVRVSVLVRTSKTRATETRDMIGWRVRNESGIPYKFVDHPTDQEMDRATGPMWIGPIWDGEIAGRMSEERALQLCYPTNSDIESARSSNLEWTKDDIEYSRREIERTVRHIASCANLFGGEHVLYDLDMLSKKIGKGHAPKMVNLVSELENQGHLASQTPTHRPMFVTNASHSEVVEIFLGLIG